MTTRALERRPQRRSRSLSPFFSSQVLDRFFRDDFFNWFDGGGAVDTIPSLNIREENNEYKVELAAPGLKREDFDINVEGNILTISCDAESRTKEEREEGFYRREYDYSSFSRSVTLPDAAEAKNITAKYTDGILHLTVPKKPEAQKLTQKIKVE